MEAARASSAEATAIGLYPSWWKRVAGWLVDTVLLSFVWVIVFVSGSEAAAWTWVAFPLYFTLCHGSSHGQTLGKRLLGMAVRDRAGLGRLGYWRAFARWLVTTVFWTLFVLPGVLDGLSPLWDCERRAWHDRAAGSVVVEL